MATVKIEIGQKDSAIVLCDLENGEGFDAKTWLPKGDKDDPVTPSEMAVRYCLWCLENDELRGKYMDQMSKSPEDKECSESCEDGECCEEENEK